MITVISTLSLSMMNDNTSDNNEDLIIFMVFGHILSNDCHGNIIKIKLSVMLIIMLTYAMIGILNSCQGQWQW